MYSAYMKQGYVYIKTLTMNTIKMEKEVSITPIIDFAPKAILTIVKCQKILAKHCHPEPELTADECINELLGILDNKELVKQLNSIL